MNKKELRNIIRERKRQFSGQQLEELSLLVLDRLRRNIRLQQARSILLYYSLPDEVNTHQFIDELVNQGKQVFLPVVVDGENMEIREYTRLKRLRKIIHFDKDGKQIKVEEKGHKVRIIKPSAHNRLLLSLGLMM